MFFLLRRIYAGSLPLATPTRRRCAPPTSPQGGDENPGVHHSAALYLVLALVLFLLSFAQPTAAHGLQPVEPSAFWQSWSFDPWVIVPLLLAHWLYGRGVLRLWTKAGRGRGVGWAHVFAFVAGEIVVAIALISPLDQLGGTLVSAHMIQHSLLVVVAPPLLLSSRPGAAFAWGLPEATKRGSMLAFWRWLSRLGRVLSQPVPAVVLHAIALWSWHAPPLFEAALRNQWIHSFEHLTFFGTALLFWQAVLSARQNVALGIALAITFVTLIHTGLLGALLTFASSPLYGWYIGRTELWGLTALEDQQLAGLIMWVPMGMVYVGTAVVLMGRLLSTQPAPS